MNAELASLACLRQFPRLLIAGDYASAVEPLLRTFMDNRLDVDFDLCTSRANAVRKLSTGSYQLVIAGAQLAERDHCLLLKRSQALKASLPFVITASASETEAAGRVLSEGAFDVIPTPPEHEQTVTTILLGLWQSKLRSLIASKERVVERYRQHLASYPGDPVRVGLLFSTTLSAFEKTILAVERSLVLLDESAAGLTECAIQVEHEARTNALVRLDSLRHRCAHL